MRVRGRGEVGAADISGMLLFVLAAEITSSTISKLLKLLLQRMIISAYLPA